MNMTHLSRNPRGKFVLKIVVDQGPRFSGRRITQQLRTADPVAACRMRDFALELLIRAGNVIQRPQNVGHGIRFDDDETAA